MLHDKLLLLSLSLILFILVLIDLVAHRRAAQRRRANAKLPP